MRSVKRLFTLVEVLAVIAVLGILMSLAYGGYSIVQTRNQRTQMQTALDAIYVAIINYHSDKGAWPDLFEGGSNCYLRDKDYLLTRTILTKEQRNVVENILKFESSSGHFLDIWGEPIRAYRSARMLEDMDVSATAEARGVQNVGSFDLISLGADGILGKPPKGGEVDDVMPNVQ